jgi:hypothetical protein
MPVEFISYADMQNDNNPRAVIGGNAPPAKTPYEEAKERIEELYAEARGWLDGEPVTSQEQADAIQKLMRLIQEAEKKADECRKAEAKPFDDGKAEVQARYNPLIQKDKGKTSLAVNACKEALAPWLYKLEQEQRAAAAEARRKADELEQAAREAVRQRDAANLEQREAAEALIAEAARAQAQAKKAEGAKAQAKGVGRAASLRTYYTPEVTDYREFARFVWTNHMDDMKPVLDELARRYVATGRHTLPGVVVHEEKRVA